MSLHQTSGRRGLGVALALATSLQWGVLPLVLQRLLRTLDSQTIVWGRFSVAAVLLFGWLALRRQLPGLRDLRGAGVFVLTVAVLGLAVNYVTFMLGLDLTSAGTAQVLIQLAPFLLAVGGWMVFREQARSRQLLGYGLLFLGLLLWFERHIRGAATETGAGFRLGILSILVASFTWAAYGLAQKQLLARLPVWSILLVVYASCAVLYVPLADLGAVTSLGATDLVWLGCAGCATITAYGCFAQSLRHLEASRVGAVIAMTPLFTLAFNRLGSVLLPEEITPEPLSLTSLAGAGLVVAGSALGSLGGGRRAESAAGTEAFSAES